VVCNRATDGFLRFNPTARDELLNQFSVVNHLVIAAKLFIFVSQRVETMWAGGKNFFKFIPIQCFYILLCHHLEQVLVSQPPGRIAGAGFFHTKNSILYPGSFQYFYHCLSHLLIAGIVSSSATYPIQVIHFFICFTHFGHCQSFGPILTVFRRNSPGISVGLHVFEGGDRLGRKPAFFEYQVTPHFNYFGNMFDEHRAGLLAGAAGGARPQFFFQYRFANHFLRHFRRFLLTCLQIYRAVLVQIFPQVGDHFHRRKQFLGNICRTHIRASPAFCAGIQVH